MKASFLTLKQELCWWVGKEQTKHWLCLPTLEVDASKQGKTWVSSQSCTPYVHSLHQGSPAAQLQVPAQLCKSCHSSPQEGPCGQLTYQLLCHTVTQDKHSRGSKLWAGAFLHLPHWVADVQKRLLSKMSKVDLNSHLESRQPRGHRLSWLFLLCWMTPQRPSAQSCDISD